MVLGQAHHLHGGEQLGEPEDQPPVGPVPPVDGLVGVAHHGQVVPVGQDRPEEAELRRVDVLELVDGQVPVAPPHVVPERRVPGDQVGRREQYVVQVDGPAPPECLLVGPVPVGYLRRSDGGPASRPEGGVPVLPGAEAPRLGPADLTAQDGRRARVAGDRLEDPVAVLDQAGGRLAGVGRPTTEQGERQLVERAEAHPGARRHAAGGGTGAEGRRHAVGPEPRPQLGGGATGEGADDGVVRRRRAVVDPSGHPQREDPGLARPGAGQDAEGRRRCVDRLALGRREGLQVSFEACHRPVG